MRDLMRDESKLPRWAQERLTRLRGQVADLRELFELHDKSAEETTIYWEKYDPRGPEPSRFFIPDKLGRIFFDLGRNRHGQEEKLEVSPDTGRDGTRGIRVRCYYGTARLMPESTNSIYITALDPRDNQD